MWELILNWDAGALLWVQENLRTPFLNSAMNFITNLGNAGMVWIVFSILLIINKTTRKIGVCCILSLVLSLLINNTILKNLINRPRPFSEIEGLVLLAKKPTDASFPSGHTAASFSVATVIVYNYLNKKNDEVIPGILALIAVVLAILISFSRIYLGCHYPLDVIGGILSGIMCGVIAIYTQRKICKVIIKDIKR